MPVGSKVHKLYTELVKEGYSKGKAARIAQHATGQALMTGKPPRSKGRTRKG